MISNLQIRLVIAGVIAVIAFSLAWYAQDLRYQRQLSDIRAKQAEALQAATTKTIVAERQAHDAIAALDLATTTAKAKVRVVTETVEKEVVRYVKSPTAKCQLDNDWVRITNAAAGMPENTQTPSTPNDATTNGVGADTVLEVVTKNYRECLTQFESLRGLQNYVKSVM